MSRCKIISKSQPAIQIFETCSLLPDSWDALLPSGHFLKKENLSMTEKSGLPDVQPLYLLLSQQGQPQAAAYFQVLRLKEKHLDIRNLKSLPTLGWRSFLQLFSPRLLVAGHLFRHDISSFYFNPDCTGLEVFRQYEKAIQKALRISGALAVLVKDMPEKLIPYFQHYAPEYLLLRNDISMQLNLSDQWQDLQDYEKSLKHKYAQRFRKVRGKWNKVEVKELSSDEVIDNKLIIYDLYKKVSDHQRVRLGFLSPDYLPLLKQQNEEQLKIWLAFENGQPVAFFSAWVRDEELDMFYIGMDYAFNENLQLYFNVLFFALEQAIFLRKKKLILGRTALEAKARLGCRPQYLSTFLFFKNAALRKIILALQSRILSGEGEWENRHPFK